jgi:hypothetical protein
MADPAAAWQLPDEAVAQRAAMIGDAAGKNRERIFSSFLNIHSGQS